MDILTGGISLPTPPHVWVGKFNCFQPILFINCLKLEIMQLELIQSVNPIIPSKGSNAGKQMFVINGKHWAKVEPKSTDTHVCLEEAEVTTPAVGDTPATTKKYLNVTGYSTDTRMTIDAKIKTLTSYDPGYSQAIAFLLK